MTASAPTRLDEVQRLTSALADQVLDAQVMGRPVPDHQAVALAQAANLLHDHGMEWPPMLKQALHGLTEDATSAQGKAESVIDGLTRLMGAFRRERGQQ